jgi:hypothetical protein
MPPENYDAFCKECDIYYQGCSGINECPLCLAKSEISDLSKTCCDLGAQVLSAISKQQNSEIVINALGEKIKTLADKK